MSYPPYQLRQNKAVDRLLLLEVMRALDASVSMAKLCYYGLGGAHLEEYRLISDAFPKMKMVSLESKPHIYRRQLFHRVSKNLEIHNMAVGKYLDGDYPEGDPCVFWLDYTLLDVDRINEFERLLSLVGRPSIVKITIRAQYGDGKIDSVDVDKMKDQYGRWLKSPISAKSLRMGEMPKVVEGILQMAAERALSSTRGRTFKLVHSKYYNDGTQMLSVTGIVCDPQDEAGISETIKGIAEVDLAWGKPEHINVPVLSLKERLHLEGHMPASVDAVEKIEKLMDYQIDDSAVNSREKMLQYVRYQKYYPLFARVSV